MGKPDSHGPVIAIGGAEDKAGDKKILRDVADRLGGGALAICTVATSEPDETYREYRDLFEGLGVQRIVQIELRDRHEAFQGARDRLPDDLAGVFFTGGDQLRITSQLGDTPVFRRLLEMHANGLLVAGTSAGASMLSETMLVSGDGSRSLTVEDALKMAPGLGFVDGVVIDQHFAERGRLGRVVAAVTQNPRHVGLGIDEDTACVFEGRQLTVIGSGGVYVVDATSSGWSNLTDEDPLATMAVFDIDLHILGAGMAFDLDARRPKRHPEDEAKPRTLPEGGGLVDLPREATPAPLIPEAPEPSASR